MAHCYREKEMICWAGGGRDCLWSGNWVKGGSDDLLGRGRQGSTLVKGRQEWALGKGRQEWPVG